MKPATGWTFRQACSHPSSACCRTTPGAPAAAADRLAPARAAAADRPARAAEWPALVAEWPALVADRPALAAAAEEVVVAGMTSEARLNASTTGAADWHSSPRRGGW